MENILLADRHALLAKHQEQLPARPMVLALACGEWIAVTCH